VGEIENEYKVLVLKNPNGMYPSQILGSARENTPMWDKFF